MIDWEQKREIAEAINNNNFKHLEDLALKYVGDFDCQAWDMFACFNIVEAYYSKGFFDKIKPYYKKANDSGLLKDLSMRSAIRLELAFGKGELEDD